MSLHHAIILAAAGAAAALLHGQVLAQADGAKAPPVGIKGYDPVAYFTDGRPVKGAPSINYDFDDSRYLFSNAQHRRAFAGSPTRYEPQFGGLCATGIAFDKKVESDPEQWAIVGGKLYLFSSVEAREMAQQDPSLLERARHTAAARR